MYALVEEVAARAAVVSEALLFGCMLRPVLTEIYLGNAWSGVTKRPTTGGERGRRLPSVRVRAATRTSPHFVRCDWDLPATSSACLCLVHGIDE